MALCFTLTVTMYILFASGLVSVVMHIKHPINSIDYSIIQALHCVCFLCTCVCVCVLFGGEGVDREIHFLKTWMSPHTFL